MLQTTVNLRTIQQESEKTNLSELNSKINNHKTTTNEFIKKHKLPSNTNIVKIRAYLDKLTIKVNTIIDCEGTNIEYIVRKSIQIDWVILQLALKTPLFLKENDQLKETAWTLLEKLEAYCSTKLGISIW